MKYRSLVSLALVAGLLGGCAEPGAPDTTMEHDGGGECYV
jgi:hypothetical protein